MNKKLFLTSTAEYLNLKIGKAMHKQDLESYVKELVSQPKPEIVPPRTFRKHGEFKLSTAMLDNIDRCRADRGGEFHPVTIS